MTDHATEAAELLANDRADVATAHALRAIHEQLADIARRLPRPVVNDLRAEVQPPAHPGGFVREPEVAIRGGRLTTSITDELRAQVANLHWPAPDCGLGIVACIQRIEADRQPDQTGNDPSYRQGQADGWNSAMDMIRDSLIAHGYTASPDEEGDQ